MNTASNIPARNTKIMNRFDLTSRLIAKLKNEEAVIGGIGNTNFDLWAAGHRPQNFYMLGSMGLAFPIALGVALAQPKRRIFALEGDGALLMQLGSLAMEHHTCTRLDEFEFIVDRSIKQAVTTQAPVALILSPLLTGGKVFDK